MTDLGLTEVLPSGWATPTAEGLTFRDLTIRGADHLVRVLEDLAAALDDDVVIPAPGPGQLSLFPADS